MSWCWPAGGARARDLRGLRPLCRDSQHTVVLSCQLEPFWLVRALNSIYIPDYVNVNNLVALGITRRKTKILKLGPAQSNPI